MRLPDYHDLWRAHDRAQAEKLERLPKCSECGHPIQSEECYEFDDGLICPRCLKENHRVWTDDYTEE